MTVSDKVSYHKPKPIPDSQQKLPKDTVNCPIDFSKLSIGALRKYQYKFKLNAGLEDKALLKKQDLIRAIERHYMQQFSVDEVQLIGRFLRLEKQDKIESFGCTTR